MYEEIRQFSYIRVEAAIAALQGLLAEGPCEYSKIVKTAVRIADMLIEELKNEPEGK